MQMYVSCLLPCFQLTENCVNVMNVISGVPERRRAFAQVWQSHSTLIAALARFLLLTTTSGYE